MSNDFVYTYLQNFTFENREKMKASAAQFGHAIDTGASEVAMTELVMELMRAAKTQPLAAIGSMCESHPLFAKAIAAHQSRVLN